MSVPPGVTVFCDPTLGPAIRALNGLAGIPSTPLSAPAAAMLAQLSRHTHNDVLFTLATAMDQAVAQQLVKPATRIDGFSNTLVIARRRDRPAPASGRLAVTDATPASGLNGRAVLAANNINPAGVIGAATTADVAFLLINGDADFGLLYRTDVTADPRLTTVKTLAADPSLTAYAGALCAKSSSPNAAAFLALLHGPGAAQLRAAGLQVAA